MIFEKSICEVCGCDYEYDIEASPDFCDRVCSQGCNDVLRKENKPNAN